MISATGVSICIMHVGARYQGTKVDGTKGAGAKFLWFSLFVGVQCPVSPKPWKEREGGGGLFPWSLKG